MIGLDTSAIIDFFKGNEKIKYFMDINKEPLAATTISYLELFFGLDLSNSKHQVEAQYYSELFENLYNIELTKETCEKASEIFWKLRKEGKTIEQFDCVIAALFLSNGIKKILTRNKKHFDNIKELSVISY